MLHSNPDHLEKYLVSIFIQISQASYDKAKEVTEKEREMTRPGQFRQLLSVLLNFIEAERSYSNLGFLSVKNKMFLRKDNSLKTLYESMRGDLHRIEDVNAVERPVNVICIQLGQFVTARIQLVDLYERLYALGTGPKLVKYDDLYAQVEGIIEMHTFSFSVAYLSPIKASLMWECETLMNTLGALMELQAWNFLPSLMHLHAAHSKLTMWEKSLQSKETWKLGFGASFLKGTPLPGLYQWLAKFKLSVINKFTLYFYHTLALQTTYNDMRAYISSKHNTDFYLKFQQLQKKCFAVLLVFETSDLPNWSGPGYIHPLRSAQPPYSQYIPMVAHPTRIGSHMGNISKALSERSPESVVTDRISSFYSEDKFTYLSTLIDPRVTFVAIFEGRRDERDASISAQIFDFCTHLRCGKVYAALKVTK